MFDVAVIGGGTAGLTAALAARHAGASVCLIERESRLGGDYTFHGCVPSKTLLALARVAHDARLAAAAGILDDSPAVVFSRESPRSWTRPSTGSPRTSATSGSRGTESTWCTAQRPSPGRASST